MTDSNASNSTSLFKNQLNKMRKDYRSSQNALPINAVIASIITATVIGCYFWFNGTIPWWACSILILIAWFGFIGDLINILYLRKRIAVEESSYPRQENGNSSEPRIEGF